MNKLFWDRIWITLAAAALLLALYMAFLYAPTERTMGDTQRIFYFHVPAAFVAFAAFFACCFASIGYLVTRSEKWDHHALAHAEIGVLFSWIVLTTGPIWAKKAWGTPWVWDARLTTTLILFLIYVGYLLVRSLVDDPDRARRLAAVVGIVGAADVPIVYMANRWWETQHPPPMITEEGGLEPKMRTALLACTIAFFILYVALARVRVGLARDENEVRDIEAQLR